MTRTSWSPRVFIRNLALSIAAGLLGPGVMLASILAVQPEPPRLRHYDVPAWIQPYILPSHPHQR